MKKKICAILLSSCSLIGGAERKSDASIIGKTLKYGSAAVAATAHLAAFVISAKLYKNKDYMDNFLGPQLAIIPYVGGYLKFLADNFCYKAIGIVNLLDLWLIDSPCLNLYTLGKYLDGDFNKSNANQEKKSSKETVLDKNKNSEPKDKKTKQFSNEKVSDKNSKPKDKNPTLNENSKKTKV